MRTKGSAQELENRRRLAVQRVRDGYRVADVATFLGVTQRSVYRWLAATRDQGERCGLNARPHLGPRTRLDLDQDLSILASLCNRPEAHGFASAVWTAPLVARLIERRFGVRYHPRYVNRWLRDRGVTPQKPRRKAREQDPEAVAAWLAGDWRRLWERAEADGGWLVFVDEAGLLLEPLWRRSQAPRGCPPEVAVPRAHRRKVSVIAAVAWSPSRRELRLVWRTLCEGHFNGAGVADFMGQVLAELPAGQTVTAVWDGAQIHKGPALRALRDGSAGRFRWEYQPPYTPEANPVEQLWKWLKYDQLANVVARGAWHLEVLANIELTVASADPGRLESFVHASALPLPKNLIGSVAETMTLAA